MSTNFKPRVSAVLEDENDIYIFNPADIISESDKVSSITLQNMLDNYVSEVGGSTVVGDITLGTTAGLAFEYGNERQIRAFSEARNDDLSSVVNKTQYMTIDQGITAVTNLNVTDTLTLTYNLPANKIGSGNVNDAKLATLSDISTSNTIQSQLDNKQNIINSGNRLNVNLIANGSVSNEQLQSLSDLVTTNSVESRLQTHSTDIQTNSDNISTNTNDISTNATNIQTNTDNISTNTTDISTHTGQIADLVIVDEDLQLQIDSKASITSVSDISDRLVDVTYATDTTSIANTLNTNILIANSLQVNNSVEIDGSFIISNNNYTITDQQFAYLKDIDSDVKTNLTSLQSQMDSNDNDISTLQTTVSSHSTTISSHTTSLSSNATAISTLQTASTSQASTLSSHTSTLSSHTSSLTSNATAISDLQSADTAINSAITDLTNNKQDVLNSSNRLNASNIADGSISNNAFQTLYGINTNESIQHQINTLNTTLENLDGLQDLDITAITDLQSTVSGKQDSLSGSNKLNPAYINAGSGTLSATKMQYLSTVTSDVQSQIDSLTSSQGSTYNGSNMLSASYVSSTYGVQDMNVDEALADLRTAVDYNYNQIIDTGNAKQNVIDATHQVSMHYIETTTGNTLYDYITQNDTDISDINTALSGKQDTITDGSLSIEKTDGLQTTLNGKWNTPLNATALGFVNIGSSLTGLLSEKQSTISNIGYFDATSSIQTQLNGKQATITDNSLSIARTSGLQTALDGKHATIDTSNKLASTLIFKMINYCFY
jgi:chromosome segregation ATPase